MASKENALLVFESEFSKKGLVIPAGLLVLLRGLKRKDDESAEEMRRRTYRRIWAIMWYGSKIGEEVVKGTSKKPTYVYPEAVKNVIRDLVSGELQDYPNPSGIHVYHVTLQDMVQAKWPAVKTKAKH